MSAKRFHEQRTSRGHLLPAALWLATVISVFWTGAELALERAPDSPSQLLAGWVFALPLLVILHCHEFGHYLAARWHRVPATLPHFLPAPIISPFGTMGAIISMPERIRSRRALLDIGAAGPLAGLVAAVPILCVGLLRSEVKPVARGALLEGQSLLYVAIKRCVLGPLPEGHDVFLHPTAFAGWTGLFLTMVNLVPWGQLDGGHIAYAWLGDRHSRHAAIVRYGVLGAFSFNVVKFLLPAWHGTSTLSLPEAISSSGFWLTWFVVLTVMKRITGEAHPACEDGELGAWRKLTAALCLLLFVLLFMPTPFSWT